jgi:hypothetical protein
MPTKAAAKATRTPMSTRRSRMAHIHSDRVSGSTPSSRARMSMRLSMIRGPLRRAVFLEKNGWKSADFPCEKLPFFGCVFLER